MEQAAEDAMDILPDLPEVNDEEPQEPCTVVSVDGEIALVRAGKGLATVTKTGAIVDFQGGAIGVLLAWKEGVGLIQLTTGEAAAGERVRATGNFMTTAASASLCGRILDPTGQPIDGRPPPPVPAGSRLTFAEYKGMHERTNQYRPLFTGVIGVDFAVPIGRGQTMLFQGTDVEQDKRHLWPDLMSVRAGPGTKEGPALCIAVCADLDEATALRERLEARGCWQQCAVIVAGSSGDGSKVVAMNAALAFAEQINDENGEATVLMDLEPMHRVWNILAAAAGEERQAKGIIVQEDQWTELEGTVLRESIAERRKFWFALISRAANSKEAGSVSVLAWLWEQAGGLDVRKQKALERKLEQIMAIPRITDAMRQKMVQKVKDQAAAEGVVSGDEAPALEEPGAEIPGVPNWEIEELKSITDGHILLRRPSKDGSWSWSIDPYKSLPRLGTDAMHPALCSVDAHKLRLKMMQGRDRATMLHDTLGAPGTLDRKERLEMRFVDLILEQPAGEPLRVDEEVARLVVVANPQCGPLREPGGCSTETLNELAARLLASEAGRSASGDIDANGEVTNESGALLAEEMTGWASAKAVQA